MKDSSIAADTLVELICICTCTNTNGDRDGGDRVKPPRNATFQKGGRSSTSHDLFDIISLLNYHQLKKTTSSKVRLSSFTYY